jgi:hypothetical protein
MRHCEFCGAPIDSERLVALPYTTTCAEHSQVEKRRGFMISTASKGCASTLLFLPEDPEAKRRAIRAHKRSR